MPGLGLGEGILGGIQSLYGIYQQHKGNQMAAQNQRPNYEIPDEIKQNLSQAQNMALEGLPAEQKQQYLQNIQRSQNFGLGAQSDRKGGLAGLGSIVQSGNDASMNLLSADAQARRQNQGALMNARTAMAGYKDKAFEFNKANPFYEKAAAARAMQGAGQQNIWGGLGTAAGVIGRNQMLDKNQNPNNPMNAMGLNGTEYGTPGLGGNPQTMDQFFGY